MSNFWRNFLAGFIGGFIMFGLYAIVKESRTAQITALVLGILTAWFVITFFVRSSIDYFLERKD